jgi:hypothetical protein
MRLFRRHNDPQRFDELVSRLLKGCICGLPLWSVGRKYYESTLEDVGADLSFLIEDRDGSVIVLMCDVTNGYFGRYGMPAEVLLDEAATADVSERAIREAIGEIRRLAAENVKIVELLTTSPGRALDFLSASLVGAGFEAEPHFRAVVDLLAGPEVILADMRKGHRQQVRWGRDNLTISLVDQDRPDFSDFESYRALHAEVSGRVTREESSWGAMWEVIASGEGRLVLSYLERCLVGGTLILDSMNTAFYASGAYRRELFHMPLSHYPIYTAMIRSAAAGNRWFDVGDVSSSPRTSDKQRSISYFKRGFSSRLKVGNLWRWQPPADVSTKRIDERP